MGNFHCIPESCGKVVYREYLPPVIRWKYPNEDWQEIEGDDYAIEQSQGGKTEGVRYNVVIYFNKTLVSIGSFYRSYTLTGPIGTITYSYFGTYSHQGRKVIAYRVYINSGSGATPTEFIYCWEESTPPEPNEVRIHSITRIDGQEDPKTCTFTVYKSGQIVHQENRNVCSEVEKLDSRLSNVYKEVKVNKLAYLEGIEVVNYAKDILAVTNNFRSDIPSWCLNIYSTSLQPNIIPLEGAKYLDAKYIAQICSPPTLPPPSYQVICDCEKNCEFCPGDTCPIRCGDRVCCYNDLGVSIKEIPISNYCG